MNFANTEEIASPKLLMESAWHLNNWSLAKECMIQVDASGDPSVFVRSSLLRAMCAIVNPSIDTTREAVEKTLLDVNRHLIGEWRKLPTNVALSHVPILRHFFSRFQRHNK